MSVWTWVWLLIWGFIVWGLVSEEIRREDETPELREFRKRLDAQGGAK